MVPLDAPDFEVGRDLQMAAFPDGERLLVYAAAEHCLRIVDSDMCTIQRPPYPEPSGGLAVNENSFYVTHLHGARVERLAHGSTRIAYHEEEVREVEGEGGGGG